MYEKKINLNVSKGDKSLPHMYWLSKLINILLDQDLLFIYLLHQICFAEIS